MARIILVPSAGAELYVFVEGSGPPLILIHGGVGTHRNLDTLACALADHFTVVRPDVRGRGQSLCADPALCTHDQLAADVVAILDHLQIDRAAVGGASMGSHISTSAALRFPDRVASLVLMKPALLGGEKENWFPTPAQKERALAFAGVFLELVDRWREKGFLAAIRPLAQTGTGLGDMGLDTDLDDMSLLDRLSMHDPRSLLGSGAGIRSKPPWTSLDDLRGVMTPTLVLRGNDSLHPPEIGERYMTVLPDATLGETMLADMRDPYTVGTAALEIRAFLKRRYVGQATQPA